MPDHTSYMLDSMITAVDESLSYDGIVSVPEVGLEDIRSKSTLADSLRDGVDLVRTTSIAISRGAGKAAKSFKRKLCQDNSGHPASDIKEKNLSAPALPLWDRSSEEPADSQAEKLSVSDVALSDTAERNHFVREQVVVQVYGDDDTDAVPGCMFPRPSFGRTRSEPIGVEVVSRHHQKNIEDEWQILQQAEPGQEDLSHEGRGKWNKRFKDGLWQGRRTNSIRPSNDANQERLPRRRECVLDSECVEKEKASEVRQDSAVVDQEASLSSTWKSTVEGNLGEPDASELGQPE